MSQPTAAPAAPAAAPTFNFADAELPPITRSTETAGPNPFADVLKQSFTDGKGKSVTVPADQVGTVIRYIRRAANDQQIGSRIVLRTGDGKSPLDTETIGGTKTEKGRTVGGRTAVVKADGKEYKGNVQVLFAGQKRKQRKQETTATTDEQATGAETTATA